jgi:hypothetical protein
MSPLKHLFTQPFRLFGWMLLSATASARLLAADHVLFDFRDGFDPARAIATDAQVSRADGGAALRVRTGHKEPWPGITLRPPAGPWDLAAFAEVTVKVRNAGTNPVTVFCRVDNPGADGTAHCVTGSAAVNPGATESLRVPLKRASDDPLGGQLFGMRGYPVSARGPNQVDPRNITQLLLFVSKPTADHCFEVSDIRAAGTYTPPTAGTADAKPFFPFIDAFGQYRHKDWPGKLHSLAELAARRQQEAGELAARPGPAQWDKYGGWAAGPQLQATGFFRTEKLKAKWWLVDPEGRPFFSHGVDCVQMLDTTPTAGRDRWFQDFPGRAPELAEFLSRGYALKGHYAGQSPECFAFAGANLKRKYGPDWRAANRQVIQRRLRAWGLNTIGNWSDEATRLMRQTPYTDAIGSDAARLIAGSEGYWGKFPDVFDASFAESLRRDMAARRGKSAGDPWCIGYFSDNEMSWGDDVSLALAALRSGPDQAAKRAFVADLKAKYGQAGSADAGIGRLNAAWGASYASWDALLEDRQAPARDKARADLEAFYTRAAEQYFRTVRDIIKAVAPNQLYLGCRFAWVNPRAAAAAAKFCDVVSYNLYRRSIADFRFNGGADVPLLVGEFHFGALDRGMFHTGLVPVADQEARARAYKDYVLGALRHPQFVGCHWFQYQDEPVTGRVYDEENYQIGFVDVADTPYAELVRASREVGEGLYR